MLGKLFVKLLHSGVAIVLVTMTFSAEAQPRIAEPLRHTIEFSGSLREYYIRLPKNFIPEKTYWALVVVHGGGGNGLRFFMADDVRRVADEIGLDAIVISPSFSNTDVSASRFPDLGEGEFLQIVLKDVNRKYKLRDKILLTGYSNGGQFTHRFALRNPTQVEAVAPFAAGTWTTPDGRLLIDSFGEVENPKVFLSSPENASSVPERLGNMFSPRVANVAGLLAESGSEKIPFLVMCGTLDSRLDIAKKFVSSLKNAHFRVETEWPRTPHNPRTEGYQDEFKKFSQRAAEFFLQVVDAK